MSWYLLPVGQSSSSCTAYLGVLDTQYLRPIGLADLQEHSDRDTVGTGPTVSVVPLSTYYVPVAAVCARCSGEMQYVMWHLDPDTYRW